MSVGCESQAMSGGLPLVLAWSSHARSPRAAVRHVYAVRSSNLANSAARPPPWRDGAHDGDCGAGERLLGGVHGDGRDRRLSGQG